MLSCRELDKTINQNELNNVTYSSQQEQPAKRLGGLFNGSAVVSFFE